MILFCCSQFKKQIWARLLLSERVLVEITVDPSYTFCLTSLNKKFLLRCKVLIPNCFLVYEEFMFLVSFEWPETQFFDGKVTSILIKLQNRALSSNKNGTSNDWFDIFDFLKMSLDIAGGNTSHLIISSFLIAIFTWLQHRRCRLWLVCCKLCIP